MEFNNKLFGNVIISLLIFLISVDIKVDVFWSFVFMVGIVRIMIL